MCQECEEERIIAGAQNNYLTPVPTGAAAPPTSVLPTHTSKSQKLARRTCARHRPYTLPRRHTHTHTHTRTHRTHTAHAHTLTQRVDEASKPVMHKKRRCVWASGCHQQRATLKWACSLRCEDQLEARLQQLPEDWTGCSASAWRGRPMGSPRLETVTTYASSHTCCCRSQYGS